MMDLWDNPDEFTDEELDLDAESIEAEVLRETAFGEMAAEKELRKRPDVHDAEWWVGE